MVGLWPTLQLQCNTAYNKLDNSVGSSAISGALSGPVWYEGG